MAFEIGALTTGGAVAAFVAAIVSPPVGLAVLAIMAPLKSPLVIPAPGFNSLLVGAILLGCVYRLPVDRPALRPSAPLLLLFAFVVYVFAQQVPEMLSGYAGARGHLVGYQFIQLLTTVALVVAAAWVLAGRKPEPFIGAAVLSAVLAAVLAIATFGGPPTGPLGNLVGVSDAGSRVVGPFGDPNYFAVFEATAIAAALAWSVVAKSKALRILLIGASAVMATTFALTLSRGALVALLAGLLSLAFARGRRVGVLALGLALLFALVVYPLFVQWRVTTDSGGTSAQAYAILARSDQARLEAGLAGPQLFASSPLFGIGFGHYSYESGRYVGVPIAAHNWYLNVLAEQGVVGIVLWMSMLLAVAAALYRASRPARSVGYAVLVTYSVGCVFLEPPNSVQTSALAVIVIVASLVGDWRGSTSIASHPVGPANLGPTMSSELARR